MNTLFQQDAPPAEVAGRKLVGRVLLGLLVLAAALSGATAGLLLVYSTDLPQVDELEHYRPGSITELYDGQGRIIGTFALQRRVVASYEDYPQILRDALISTEDKEFFLHSGVNVWRIVGAAYRDIESGGKVQGASTLTMQLARNLFLSPDRSFHRKIQETLLAIQIERRFTKQQIFTLYANQISWDRAPTASSRPRSITSASPPKSSRSMKPLACRAAQGAATTIRRSLHPDRALKRRNLVINALLEDGKITAQQATDAKAKPLQLDVQHDPNSLAPYFVEEIRRYLENKFGSDQVHEGGLRVYTSLGMDLQKAANQAVLNGVAAYERRHGWKNHLTNILQGEMTLEHYSHSDWDDEPEVNGYLHALVIAVTPASATVKFGRYHATITPQDAAWTQKRLPELFKLGDLCYVKVLSLGDTGVAHVSLEQDSGAQGALVAIDNVTGEIKAMVGGRDFNESKFNRATQALRQVGSSFKPYVYTAAIDQGGSPDDTILDAPIII